MNIYRPRTLIQGYAIGKDYTGLLVVAVPKQKLAEGVDVIYKNKNMTITTETPKLKEIDFPDKFGRGFYTLCYYNWDPTSQLRMFI